MFFWFVCLPVCFLACLFVCCFCAGTNLTNVFHILKGGVGLLRVNDMTFYL